MNNRGSDSRICRGKVLIERLELRAFHGCFPHERQYGQMFEIDLDLTADLSEAAASDNLSAAIDYGEVVAVTQKAFCGAPRHLVEAAAFDIARALLETFARIESVAVRVIKLAPPIPAKLRGAGVEIEVKRGE
ncbi:dihydroneopterin aldolase [Methylocapsa sp. S129]|uniref:dihydroneopterin aldolase n=1 Tax=Methylocapsa sp. S129 TaxID=1641869 RepID=UPI00131A9BE1|nr:dihydroneopterin aldolase [Methylocapsa sp. S129]